MATERLPGRIREFTSYLNGLLERLDQSGGWCGVFWQRDPEGMRACLEGRELPPWDVMEALLQDLAAAHGPRAAESETARARTLHAAALAAHDTRPGAREALADRLDVMLREQRYAAERRAALSHALATAPTATEALRADLAWAEDDHARATARCAELRARIDHLNRRERGEAGPGRESERGAFTARTAPWAPLAPPPAWAAERTLAPDTARATAPASATSPSPSPAPEPAPAPAPTRTPAPTPTSAATPDPAPKPAKPR
ncbi:hypothetical protein N4P33_26540, partial [Streptomyces sp. 15-116A]|nr:hypothetical protein [Streptomyces sp. 15-116A]